MDPWSVVSSPIVIALFALCIGCLIYAWSRTIAPPFTRSVNKTMPYVGGEAAQPQVFLPGYQFFYVALFFTVSTCCCTGSRHRPARCPALGAAGVSRDHRSCGHDPEVGTMKRGDGKKNRSAGVPATGAPAPIHGLISRNGGDD